MDRREEIALLERLRSKVPTGRFTIGGGNVSADGKAATWGGEPIFGLRNPDGPKAADLIERLLSPPATETGIPDGMVLVPVEALPVFERVIRLADTLASDVPTTASAREHITDAYAALAALQPGEGRK